MDLARALEAVGSGERAASFEVFSRSLDPRWIELALAATGSATVRRRKLPAEQVVWIVIAMGLFRDRSIQEVVHHLDLVLPARSGATRRGVVTSSAVVQARDRLGMAPLETLFEQTAARWAGASADAHRWHGLAVYGVDGSALRVPDTLENEEAFGRPGSSRGAAAYPQLRLVVLMVLRSHLLAGVSLGPWSVGETTLAEPLWARLPDRSLTILDRGFLAYALLHRLATSGAERHWLIRAKSNLTWKTVRRLGPKDQIVEIPISRQTRRAHPELPETLQVRAVRYQRKGFRPQTLLTSLLDPQAYPAAEIAELYHERWELELGFDEIKTHTLEREEALRSRAPERVRQELWGLAVAYNLVRLQMEHVAQRVAVAPTRISFRHALLLLRSFWQLTAWITAPGNLPRRLDDLHQELALLVLPQRRSRRYPRAVKIKMSNYPRSL
ncbi:MAG: IS4 family transposase [Longimicrobiales bacterium]